MKINKFKKEVKDHDEKRPVRPYLKEKGVEIEFQPDGNMLCLSNYNSSIDLSIEEAKTLKEFLIEWY